MQARLFKDQERCVSFDSPRKAMERVGVSGLYINWFVARDTILLIFAYSKNGQDDLMPEQLEQLRRIIEGEYI